MSDLARYYATWGAEVALSGGDVVAADLIARLTGADGNPYEAFRIRGADEKLVFADGRELAFPGSSGTLALLSDITGGVSAHGDLTGLGADDHAQYWNAARGNAGIDARVTKAFVDALNVDADTLDGIDSAGFALIGHDHDADYSPIFTDSAGLRGLLSDEVGTGLAVFNTAPLFATYLDFTASAAPANPAGTVLRWWNDNSDEAFKARNSAGEIFVLPKLWASGAGGANHYLVGLAADGSFLSSAISFGQLTSTPTTLAGYGISDAAGILTQLLTVDGPSSGIYAQDAALADVAQEVEISTTIDVAAPILFVNVNPSGSAQAVHASGALRYNTVSEDLTSTLFNGGTLSGTNTGNVTLAGTPDYITISGQVITRGKLDPVDDINSVASAATASTLALRDSNANILADNFLAGYTTTATAAGTTTLTSDATQIQRFTGATTQTLKLPSDAALGQSYTVINESSGAVTVQSSGANTIITVSPLSRATLVCVTASGTVAASWTVEAAGPVAGAATLVPFYDANGQLTADADMAFSGSTLAITNIATTKVTQYNGVTTVARGIPSAVYEYHQTGLGAAVGSTSAIASAPATGFYRVSVYAEITTRDPVSSTLGSFALFWTPPGSSTPASANILLQAFNGGAAVMAITATGNAVTSNLFGQTTVYIKTGTALNWTMGYTSNTPGTMKYALDVVVEAI